MQSNGQTSSSSESSSPDSSPDSPSEPSSSPLDDTGGISISCLNDKECLSHKHNDLKIN